MLKRFLPRALSTPLSRAFSSAIHTPVCVIGGGTAGVSFTSQIIKEDKSLYNNVRIFDPASYHYYQPGWTFVGAGMAKIHEMVTTMDKMIPKGVEWTKLGVQKIDADNNTIITADGQKWTYDELVIASGIVNKYSLVKGLKEALDDPTVPVATIYDNNYCQKWYKLMNEFRGRTAFFHQPPVPIKCAGAPQKIMHLSHEFWKKKGLSPAISFYSAADVIFGVPKYAEMLAQISKEKGLNINLNHQLVEIKGKERIAVFKNIKDNGNLVEVPFEVFHAVPPQGPPEFLMQNKELTAPTGYVDVCQGTLRSTKKRNVWGVGDACNTPNSKTAAAITAQVPVLVHNVLQSLKAEQAMAHYAGYASCPLLIGGGKVILAEFKYTGKLDETFPMLQNKPRTLFGYFKTHLFPFAYFHLIPKGWWYGRSGIFKPSLDVRHPEVKKC